MRIGGASRGLMRSELAGSWYPDDPAELRAMIQAWIREAAQRPACIGDAVRGLILPHAGYVYSGRVAAAGVARVVGRKFRRVIVLGPTHRLPLRNRVSVPDAERYETILGEIPLDRELLRRLRTDPLFDSAEEALPGEHSVEIEFPLLQVALGEFRLAPLVVGQLDEATALAVGRRLLAELDDSTLLAVSTDFTHYGRAFGYRPFVRDVEANLRRLDLGALEFIQRRDLVGFRRYLDETGATICGRDPLSVLIAMLGQDQRVELVRYETSGHVTGDWTHVVSYVSAVVMGPWPKTQS